jgi:hypothetical protein
VQETAHVGSNASGVVTVNFDKVAAHCG